MRPYESVTRSQTDKGLFLSRLCLNLRNRQVRKDLANSQAMHRRLLDAFPGQSRAENGLLYRIDPMLGDHLQAVTALVQSTFQPNWSQLPDDYLLIDCGFGRELDGGVLFKNISAVYGAIQTGAIFQFRLRASPTKRIPWNIWRKSRPSQAQEMVAIGRKPNGPRVPVTLLSEEEASLPPHLRPSADDKLREWLIRKGAQHGFQVADVQSRPDPLTGDMQMGVKRRNEDECKLAHKAIVFEGVLRVSDADAFRQALVDGVGSGKAYGFGLLSLSRLREGS
jgi:CRISPR system Cascade subunit CasE